MGAAERTPQITHTEMERVVRRERAGGGGGGGSRHGDDDNPGHAQMVFCFPQHAGYRETYKNTNRTMCG